MNMIRNKTSHFFVYFIALILAVGTPLVLFAQSDDEAGDTVLRTGETVSVAADQVVENDFYAAANTVSMSGTVRGDMYVVGGSVTSNGTIEADLSAVGGSINVHGPVADDVRIVGGQAVIAEVVEGDVFVLGGQLEVLSSATIGGDVYFYGGEAEIAGEVAGSVFGAAEVVRIDSVIGGDVDVTAVRGLTLGDRASIAGNVNYRGQTDLVRAQNAVVEGEVSQGVIEQESEATPLELVRPLLITLFSVLLLYLFFKSRLESFAHFAIAHYGRHGLYGIGIVLAAPVILVVSVVSVLGLLLGILGFFLLGVLYLLSLVLAPVVVGMFLGRLINKTETISLTWIVVGCVVVNLLLFIPIIGPFLLLLLFVVTVGALAVTIYRAI